MAINSWSDIPLLIVYNVLLVIAIGLVTSLVFALLISRMEPEVAIREDIAIERDAGGAEIYAIKIINDTGLRVGSRVIMRFDVVDIHAFLRLVRRTEGTRDLRFDVVERAELDRPELYHLGPRRAKRLGHAHTFRTGTNIREWLATHQNDRGQGVSYRVSFTVIARHGFSGVVRETSRRWRHRDEGRIRPGRFGLDLDFLPATEPPVVEAEQYETVKSGAFQLDEYAGGEDEDL
jgi:hypothetical protein